MKLKDLSARRELYAYLLEEDGLTQPEAPAIVRKENRSDWPLSYAQTRLWFLDQLGGANAAYNISFAVRLKGRLDIRALERSFSEIIRRHEVLRARFLSEEGQARQVIDPPYAVELEPSDLSGADESAQQSMTRSAVMQQAQQPFDLGTGPLVRVRLLRLSPEDHVAVLVMHHIISDGWSTGVLVRELVALYEAYRKGEPSPLPDLPVQYADYAEWQRGRLQGEVLEELLAYWRKQLEGAPTVLELPTDRPRPAVKSFSGSVERFEVSACATV